MASWQEWYEVSDAQGNLVSEAASFRAAERGAQVHAEEGHPTPLSIRRVGDSSDCATVHVSNGGGTEDLNIPKGMTYTLTTQGRLRDHT